MPTIIRSNYRARLWLRSHSLKRSRYLPPDNLRILGHCVGVVARAFCGGAAGYYDAHAMLRAVRRAGKLQTGRPKAGAVVFWSGGKHGHVAVQRATVLDQVWTNDMPDAGYIGSAKRSDIAAKWGYKYEGWCWAEDVPGWRKA